MGSDEHVGGDAQLEHGEKVTLDTEFEVTEEFSDTPAPDGTPTVEIVYEGVYIRVPKSEVSRIQSDMLCCMGCGDSVAPSQAKKSADGSPRCPGCSRPEMEEYNA